MINAEEKKSKLRYIRAKDIFACFVFIIMMPVALIAKIFVHDFWLVGEEKNEARDNGYWFFKYVRENHPKQKIAYVINRKCADYQNVKDLGKIIPWGGFRHWFWYLTAKKNISSQKGCKPNAAACYLFEVKLGLWRNKRYFLQHGITINDPQWLYYKNCKFRLFVCGAKPEFEFVKSKFGYPEKNIAYTGFCRFDGLHDFNTDGKTVLVMPTWRSYIVRPHGSVSAREIEKNFTETDYYKKWTEFLTSNKLSAMLKENSCKLIFYPHRNMQIFIEKFRELELGSNIEIADPSILSVQQALKQTSCLITDYSSVFFDFAYMKKPVIFYQFDEADFRANQYSAGYFDYHNNSLGAWCDNLGGCLQLLEVTMKDDFACNDRVHEFFELYDTDNCKRNYEAVCKR